MGNFRVKLPHLLGIRFDSKLAEERLRAMGIEDRKTLKHILTNMAYAHERRLFLASIGAKEKYEYDGQTEKATDKTAKNVDE